MASETDLVNTALIRLGQPAITALADDNARARAASAIYPSVRDEVLSMHRWNEAVARVALAVNATAPSWGFANAYDLPADFIRFAHSEDMDTDYRIEGNQILTDRSDMNIIYIRRITDINLMSPGLQDAISKRLSAEIAIPLTGSDAKQDRMWRLFVLAMTDAQFADSQQAPIEQIAGGTWLNSRSGSTPVYRSISSTAI